MQRPGRATLLVMAGYLAATLIYLAPLLPRWDRDVPSLRNAFDVPFQAFVIAWGWAAVGSHPHDVFNAPIFYPEPRTLTYMDHLLGEVAAAAPVLLIAGSVAAGYNFLIALSYLLSAWFTYRLARAIGASRRGAFLSGILFAFSTYRLGQLDLLNQLQTEFLPLGLYFGVRYLQAPRFRNAVGLLATAVAQLYFGWYYAYILFIAVALLALYGWRKGLPLLPDRGRWRYLLLGVVAVLVAAPSVIPYAVERGSMPEFRRTLGQAALYSADVLDYIRTSDLSVPVTRFWLPAGRDALFPGVILVALGAIGMREIRPRLPRIASYFPWLALVAFILSLGPVLNVAAHRILIPLPYALVYYLIPGIAGLRAPLRFAVLVFLAGSVLAGIGYGAVEAWSERARRRAGLPLLAGLAAIAMATAWPGEFNTVALPTADTMPPVYRWLRQQSPKEPVLEFPTPARDEDETATQALRQYCVVLHGSPRLDGCSGFVSPRYRAFRRDIQAFPSAPALALATDTGARWIVVHFADYGAAQGAALRGRIASSASLTRAAGFGADVIYRLDPRPAVSIPPPMPPRDP